MSDKLLTFYVIVAATAGLIYCFGLYCENNARKESERRNAELKGKAINKAIGKLSKSELVEDLEAKK